MKPHKYQWTLPLWRSWSALSISCVTTQTSELFFSKLKLVPIKCHVFPMDCHNYDNHYNPNFHQNKNTLTDTEFLHIAYFTSSITVLAPLENNSKARRHFLLEQYIRSKGAYIRAAPIDMIGVVCAL